MTTPEQKATREVIKTIKEANLKLTVYLLGMFVVVGVLAGFGLWRWAFLVLAGMGVKALIDGALGITAAVAGVMMQAAMIDERLKKHG